MTHEERARALLGTIGYSDKSLEDGTLDEVVDIIATQFDEVENAAVNEHFPKTRARIATLEAEAERNMALFGDEHVRCAALEAEVREQREAKEAAYQKVYIDEAAIAEERRRRAGIIDDQRARIAALEATLTRISAIRDSIVGMQGFNFSEHAYPLVAALDEAGFKGAGYECAKANLGTLIEQREAAEAKNVALEVALRSHPMRRTADFGRKKCWCCGKLEMCGCTAFAGDETGASCVVHTEVKP